MEMKLNGSKGQSKATTFLLGLVAFVSIALVVGMSLPYITAALGLNFNQQNLPITQGIVVSSVQYPSSISPSTNFNVNFLIANNINGKSASNINLCLDNLGLFISQKTNCTKIPSLFAGGTVPETFSLSTPSNSYYENVPYTQLLGYFINYSYNTEASQSLEFVSQETYNANSYPTPTFGSFGNTAGPVSIISSAQQPLIYGAAAQLQLTLSNVGDGIVIGPVKVNVSMDPSLLDMAGALGFSAISSGVYGGEINLGSAGTTVTLPITLASSEQSTLSSNGIPYVSSDIKISISYEYEQNGFFPISFNVQNYYLK